MPPRMWSVSCLGSLLRVTIARIYGVSPETFSPNTESFIPLIHADDRPAIQAWIDVCSADKKPGTLEFRTVWPDGRVHFIGGRGELIRDADGRPTKMSGTAQDITDHKQAESSLRLLGGEVSVEKSYQLFTL